MFIAAAAAILVTIAMALARATIGPTVWTESSPPT